MVLSSVDRTYKTEARKKILMIDDNITNLNVGRNVIIKEHDIFTAASAERALLFLQKLIPDLILLDVEMPDVDGYELIRILKNNPDFAGVPVIFVTAKSDPESELTGLSLGAVDYITKPFSPALLLKRIGVHLKLVEQNRALVHFNENLNKMVAEKTATIVELQNAILHAIGEIVECRDNTTGGHLGRTQSYLRLLIDELVNERVYQDELAGIDFDVFIQSALLHDVGKIGISDRILKKPGKLTEEEFNEMKGHTLIGADIIDKISKNTSEKAFLEQAKLIALTHHEKWNGLGYPNGLKGSDIPLQGRIMAIVDVYDALVSKRPYKAAFPHEEAVQIIVDGAGTHFDPLLVSIFQKVEASFANT